ncbi:MAG TPA: ATP-binding protein [Longimicrobiales bacterium]|nr:ATP-binding protein [Longimicrobiales bacterium]
MSDNELRELLNEVRLARTDLAHIEVKKAKTDCPKRLWETLSSFSNSPGGGVIVLGVDEASDFAVTGVDDAKKVLQDLASQCAEMEPRLSPPLAVHHLDGKAVVVAQVNELLPGEKPCYYRASGLANGVFVRVGDADRQATPYEVYVLLSARGQPDDDAQPVAGANKEDLDSAALSSFVSRVRVRRKRFRDKTDEQILRGLKVVVPLADTYVPSVAGLLVFGREPQAFFPQFAVLATAYPGARKGELGPSGERQLDDLRIEGSLREMVADTLAFLQLNMRHSRRQAGAVRATPAEVPIPALSEAIVNALAHRDLGRLAQGTAVQVELFSDRLEIVNPGGLYGTVNVESLGLSSVSSARNRVLMQLLEDAVDPATGEAIAEHRGSGIAAMIEALRDAEMSPPRFENTISTFRVIFPRQSLLDHDTINWLRSIPNGGDLSRNQRMALALMGNGERVTNARFRQLSGEDSRIATRELGDLVDRGLTVMSQAGRGTSYSLAPFLRSAGRDGEVEGQNAAITSRRRKAARSDRRKQILELLAREGSLPRARIQEELGLTQSPVNRWLRILMRERRIVSTAHRPDDPNTEYTLAPAKGGRADSSVQG